MFEDVWNFSEGLAVVKLYEKWGFIDKNGKVAINPQFEEVWNFSEGLAAVKIEGKWGFINNKGALMIRPQFDSNYSGRFKNGRTKVTIGNRIHTIDHSGLILLDPTCDLVP